MLIGSLQVTAIRKVAQNYCKGHGQENDNGSSLCSAPPGLLFHLCAQNDNLVVNPGTLQ